MASTSARRPPPSRRALRLDAGLWHDTILRGLVFQILLVLAVVIVAITMVWNAQEALAKRGVATGFGFLFREAGFPIGESLIEFKTTDTYLRAFAVAFLNTLKVSLVSAVAASALGLLIGLARLSSNWLVARLAAAYVELFRNTPQLVQISFWYLLVTQAPGPRQAWSLGSSVFLSSRGLMLPVPAAVPAHAWMALAAVIGCVAAWLATRHFAARAKMTGRQLATWPLALLLVAVPPLVVWLNFGAPHALSVPSLRGFNFEGGLEISPEFLVLFLGLSLYIAAFIAEIVRAGIQSVGLGQVEAARSIGLTSYQINRRVVLPQALRVMMPPAASQYVSLTKNSSLGVTIGYPELFNITNTATTLSGQAIECMAMMAACYMLIAFSIASGMNWLNRAGQIRER